MTTIQEAANHLYPSISLNYTATPDWTHTRRQPSITSDGRACNAQENKKNLYWGHAEQLESEEIKKKNHLPRT